MSTASPVVAMIFPQRFNWLESMLFAPRPTDVHEAAERYAGELLSRPVAPPRLAPLPEPPPAGT